MSTLVIYRTVILNPAAFLASAVISTVKKMFSAIFFVSLVFSAVFLIIFYLIQIKSEAWEKSAVTEKEIALEQILQENKSIEISEKNNKSLDDVLTLAKELNFVEAGKINYIRVPKNGQVVIK